MDLIARMQTELAPDIFTPRVVYDGRRNLFAPRRLILGFNDSMEVRRAARYNFSSSSETVRSSPFLLSMREAKLSKLG